MMLKTRLSIVVLLVIITLGATAQVSFDNREDLENAANEYFQNGQYDKAKPLFSQLLSLSALEPNYNYRFGVCVLYTEADPMKPLPYIEGGANTERVNPEAYYFLGKAYQLNYRFDEAIVYLEKAKKAGLSAKIPNLERSIEECRNGLILYNPEIQFDPAQDKDALESEFYRAYDFRKLKGKVIPLPPDFKTKYDQKNLTGTFVYTPMNSQSLFYASYGDDGANGKDIYRLNRLPNGEWGLPMRLPDVINTKYDEDFAFFDDEASVLYFASKGHNTMGGYDIFRSEYDASQNTWSVPRNLQYPINSPYDDFLYLSDPKGRVAFFTSKRQSEIGRIRVFKTLLFDPELVEISVVEGEYDDKTDSVYNYMVATVIDPATNEVVGKYRSNKRTGKYLLILPPQNGYTMNVGPKESMGFELKFDLPQNDSDSPLQQEIAYDTVNGQGQVMMTNFFNAAGAKDSVVELAVRPSAEVEKGMVEMPDPSEILAAEKAQLQAKQEEERLRLAKLAEEEELRFAKEKAKQDSLVAVKQLALEQRAAELKRESEIRDSIAQAEQLALEAKEKAAAATDSIAKAEEIRLAQEREKLIADSIALAEQLALEAEEKAAAAADSIAKAEEIKLAQEREKLIADSIARAEQLALEAKEKAAAAADSIAKVEEIRLAQERENLIADSIARAEQLALEAEEKAAAAADSIAKAEEMRLAQEREKTIADSIAEAERLAAIEAEVEAAKRKALQDSSIVVVEDEKASEENASTYQGILAEMARKEAELLAKRAREDSLRNQAEVEVTLETETTQEEVATTVDSLQEQQLIEESDLFLQTLANLEAQKAEQDAEIAAENERMAEKKREQKALAQSAVDSVNSTSETMAVGDSSGQSVEPLLVDGELDLEQESLALTSDADPNEYLKALSEIEQKMAVDDAQNEKKYELQDLGQANTDGVDPMLQQIIAEDRKAVEEHKQIAAQKEAELREQMQRDRTVVEEPEQVLAADEVVMPVVTKKKLAERIQEKGAAEPAVVEEDPDELLIISAEEDAVEETTNQAEVIAITERDEVVTVQDLDVEEVVEEPIISEVSTEESTMTEQEATDVMEQVVGNADLETSGLEEEVILISEDEIVTEVIAEHASLENAEESVSSDNQEVVVETDGNTDKPIEEEIEIAASESNTEKEESIEPRSEAEAPNEMVDSQSQQLEEVEVSTVSGQIHFMVPAMRDYSKRKADFSGIEDKSIKRMVQRMRAEDIGRMAVLKNMRNQWVNAGKTKTALDEIKGNERNQDVLADIASRPSREEIIREPFDRNELKARENVHYKLVFELVSEPVTERIATAMSPEYAINFATPEIGISSGYFLTLADARAEMRYYEGRGFDKVSVQPYLNGEAVSSSVVQNVPFVD